jgi:hypothetical protein
MANGDQVSGGGGGQRTYSEEDVMALMNEAARRAASEAMKNVPKRDEDEEETSVSVINPKVVKQLKDTVAVFTALKDLSSNPLQKTIEETVGGMAASVVQSAFAPRGPPPKQDIIEKLLNSQFAYGLGSGMGQRAPELVETMGRTFGTDKAGQMMDNIIGKYSGGGSGGGQSRQLSPVHSSGPSSGTSGTSSEYSNPQPASEQTNKQSEKELLLSLDPNNPEHVSAYAETQGGLPVDVARKMLMIHQDAFIEQLKRDGMNVDQISTQRGSHAQSGPPTQKPSPVQQTPPVQPVQPVSTPPIRQDIPPTYPDNRSGSPIEQPSNQSPDDIEYTEYHNMMQQDQGPGSQPNTQHNYQPPPSNVDGQQIEMMKTFATDIGKVMGDMLNKIETLNNTVFTLQSEMNDIKKQDLRQPPHVSTNKILSHREMPPRVSPHVVEHPIDMTEHISPITHIEAPSLETFEEIVDTPKVGLDIERSEDFFEENVIDMDQFQQELDEETKLSAMNSNMLSSQNVQQKVPHPELVQPTAQPVPPPVVRHVPPTTKQQESNIVVLPTPPVAQPVVQQPIVQQPTQSVQSSQPSDTKAELEIKEDIAEIPIELEDKTGDLKEIDKTGDLKEIDKTGDLKEIDKTGDKNANDDKILKDKDNKFVMPIKKTGIHKKAAYRNIKPSFKKNDEEENKVGNISEV